MEKKKIIGHLEIYLLRVCSVMIAYMKEGQNKEIKLLKKYMVLNVSAKLYL